MRYQDTVQRIRLAVKESFARVYPWFEQPENVLHYEPANGRWTIIEALEHIALILPDMLSILERDRVKALWDAQFCPIYDRESDLDKVDAINYRLLFDWPRPAHPKAEKLPLERVRGRIRWGEAKCIWVLERCPNGEGSFCQTSIFVEDFGRCDLYQWIYFTARQVSDLASRMEENMAEWRKQNQ